MMMASGSAIEALQGWVTRIKAFVEEGSYDVDATLFATVDGTFNKHEVERKFLEGHHKFVEERVARLVVDVKAMMEEFKTI